MTKNRIFITGDIHGDIDDMRKLSSDNFPEGKNLTKDDYVIICGDFGLVWDNSKEELYLREWLNDKPWTTLFVTGNHENFDALSQFPITDWCGGKVQMISDSIIHLMRGQYYEIGGRTFFTMGGAESTDKEMRRVGISWWPEEVPSYAECENALKVLEEHNYKVDYILTHTAPKELCELIAIKNKWYYERINDPTAQFLQQVADITEFKDWYFGHFHDDIDFNKYHMLYYGIKEIEN